MSRKETAGPLMAAHEYAKHDIHVSEDRYRERRNLAEKFATDSKALLFIAGDPSEADPNLVSTSEVTLETGRGDIVLSVLGVKDPETGLYKRVSLEARYGEFKSPFLPPDKPIKPVSIGVNYNERGELDTNPYNLPNNLPKLKQLRKAHEVLRVLYNRTIHQL